MKTAAAGLVAVLALVPALAQNESDWVPYFTFGDTSYFYSPSTLQKDGSLRTVKWHDTRNPQVVFKVQIDCAAHTIHTLAADQYDLNTGDWYETQDLSESPVDPLGTDASMGSHLAKAVCRPT